MLKDKNILVTGATGLVGSELIRRLSQLGYRVNALFHQSKPIDLPNVTWNSCDILDVIELEDIMQNIDIVFHCAALVSFDPSKAKTIHQLNVTGTANVVNAAVDAHVKTFIHVSSVAAIGSLVDGNILENEKWDPKAGHNAYAKSKRAAEFEVLRGQAEGLKVHIVNPTIILGNGDWNKGSSELFKKVYNGFPYYTEGVHGFVDVADVVNVMISLMKTDTKSGERYILNGANISYKKLFDLIADKFGVARPNKKVSNWQAAIIWRLAYIKAKLTGTHAMLTKETAHTAQAIITYNNHKILEALPDFQFQPIEQSIERICGEFRQKYQLKA
ncbi:NAD-dependent epimerase/dehydratase family protein [Rhizosphaericola mali]|uniref:NAD-dependent epimerase/dehydratase family protein n=1 Tax=Rhizosphaericola mali TaxID=2545455 RepID=UPI00177B0B4A|nr:NAD-dependent epimerase/dehydratase family protein [Rhizosphaericola mali]